MIGGRRLVAVVPARGGSKGIPGKNLYRIGGKTLVERAVVLARQCSLVDQVYVSTDDARTYGLAGRLGCATPKPRPATLAGDSARTIEVIANLVADGVLDPTDVLLLLQPTSPLRTVDDLNAVCALLETGWEQADAVVSVCKDTAASPHKMQVIVEGYLRSLLGGESSVPRQSLPTAYLPNGAFYLGKLNILLDESSFVPRRSVPYEMPPEKSVNLDAPLDLVLLEAVLAKKLVTLDDDTSEITPPSASMLQEIPLTSSRTVD